MNRSNPGSRRWLRCWLLMFVAVLPMSAQAQAPPDVTITLVRWPFT